MTEENIHAANTIHVSESVCGKNKRCRGGQINAAAVVDITSSMERNPAWEASSRSASQKIPRIL